MTTKIITDPVGDPVQDDAINDFVKVKMAEWDETREQIRWWQVWKRISFTPVTNFLTQALDDLIAYVDDYIDTKGADKKATVLIAIGTIYDYIAAEALPVFLKPFAGSIKNYVINEVISAMIDWIVDKYRNGDWRKPEASLLAEEWKLKAQALDA